MVGNQIEIASTFSNGFLISPLLLRLGGGAVCVFLVLSYRDSDGVSLDISCSPKYESGDTVCFGVEATASS